MTSAPITLTTPQTAALDALLAFASGEHGAQMMTLEGYAGTGKSLADDQLVQTPEGPREIGSLHVGDLVFGANGRPTRVVGVFPQGERQAYRVTFRDGSSVESDMDHLWAVWTHKQRQIGSQPSVLPLREIAEKGLRFPSGPHRFCIPLCAPVEYQKAELPMEPYLLGVLIGDGTCLGKTPTVCTPDSDKQIILNLERLLPVGMTVVEDRSPACPRYRLVDRESRGNRLAAVLRSLDLDKSSPERSIPEIYLRGSIEQRLSLLRGLMDTDGSCRKNRTTFSTKSAPLAATMANLVQSLGGTAIIHPQARAGEIEVNVKLLVCPFTLRRKAARWSPSTKNPPSRFITAIEATRLCAHTCIKVEAEDGLFLTNDYIVTHNTTLVGELVRRLGGQMDIAIAAPTNKAVGVLQEKVGPQGDAEFRSIHSFLGLKLRENEDGTRQCQQDGSPSLHQYQLAIVDECSMIGGDLFGMIVSAARSCRVLFVGDPAQLPPVEKAAHRPLLSPTFDRVQHKAILTEVVRQAADNPIIAMSMRIREAIERGQCMLPAELADAMPAGNCDQTSIAGGGEATAYNYTLGAIQNTLDARIVAYRNSVVDRYNAMIHAALYSGPEPFAVGERIIVNEHFDDARLVADEWRRAKRVTLYTSEEAVVASIEPDTHPFYPEVPAYRVLLDRDGNDPQVIVFIPSDMAAFNRHKEALWADWRRLKREEDLARMNGRGAGDLAEQRKDAAKKAGMFSRAFAPLRHVYAITAHKSQGSTIDTVVVDYSDLARMRDPFDFNRALYVAVTRAAHHVAIVV